MSLACFTPEDPMTDDDLSPRPVIVLRPTRVLLYLLGVDLVLVLLHVVAWTLLWREDMSALRGNAQRILNLDHEVSIGVWWSVVQLTLASLLVIAAALMARRQTQPHVGWLAMAAILILLSIDEEAGIHETTVLPVLGWLNITEGPLLNAWVIPGAVAVLLVDGSLALFAWRLPRASSLRLALAAFVYVTGAIGMEMVAALLSTLRTKYDILSYQQIELFTCVEEGMEMAGVSLVIWAVLKHISAAVPQAQQGRLVVVA